jgi:hypothetical protein
MAALYANPLREGFKSKRADMPASNTPQLINPSKRGFDASLIERAVLFSGKVI